MKSLLTKELNRLVSNCDDDRIGDRINFKLDIAYRHRKKTNGKLRLCVDYSTGINSALIDNRHLLLTVESITTKLNENRFFI